MTLSSLQSKLPSWYKAWDKGIKGLTKLGLAEVKKEGDSLICQLKES